MKMHRSPAVLSFDVRDDGGNSFGWLMGRRRLVVVMRYAVGGIEPQGSLFGLAVYAVQVGGCVAPASGGVADGPSPG